MKIKRLIIASSAMCVLLMASPASAILISDTVHLGGFMGATSFDAWETVVDPGIEFDNVLTSGYNAFDVDLFDSSFRITFNSNLRHTNTVDNRIELSSLDWFGNPLAFIENAVIGAETVSGTPTLLFSDHFVRVSFGQEFIHSAGQFVDIDLAFNPVPEPATMLLLGSGLIGLAAFRRRFRKS